MDPLMTRIGELGEARLLELVLPHLSERGGDLLVGPGEDDAAAWREPDGSVTVASLDAFVEGIHFDRRWLRSEEIGWRSLAFALGDLACKGALPTYALISASLPADWEAGEVDGLYRGLAGLGEMTGIRLVGGDTTASPDGASLVIAVLGRAEAAVVPRSAARPGWAVAVTGRLGAAAAGLAALMSGRDCPPAWEEAVRRPRPRLREGAHLAARGLCAGDVSDGLVREMEKFAAASGCGCRLRLAAVPAAIGVSRALAAAGGEEVELVCAGPAPAIAAAEEDLGCPLTVVGELTAGPAVLVLGEDGAPVDLPSRGHEHFR